MPRRRQRKKSPPETFRFAVEDWSLTYGLHFHEKKSALGRCWERQWVTLTGALRSKTKRKIERMELDILARKFDPEEAKDHWNAIGAVKSVGHGTLAALVWVPVTSFHTVLVAVAAGKVKGIYFSVYQMGPGSGVIRDFTIADPDEKDED